MNEQRPQCQYLTTTIGEFNMVPRRLHDPVQQSNAVNRLRPGIRTGEETLPVFGRSLFGALDFSEERGGFNA